MGYGGSGPHTSTSWGAYGPEDYYEDDFYEVVFVSGDPIGIDFDPHPDFSGDDSSETTFGFGNWGSTLGEIACWSRVWLDILVSNR